MNPFPQPDTIFCNLVTFEIFELRKWNSHSNHDAYLRDDLTVFLHTKGLLVINELMRRLFRPEKYNLIYCLHTVTIRLKMIAKYRKAYSTSLSSPGI